MSEIGKENDVARILGYTNAVTLRSVAARRLKYDNEYRDAGMWSSGGRVDAFLVWEDHIWLWAHTTLEMTFDRGMHDADEGIMSGVSFLGCLTRPAPFFGVKQISMEWPPPLIRLPSNINPHWWLMEAATKEHNWLTPIPIQLNENLHLSFGPYMSVPCNRPDWQGRVDPLPGWVREATFVGRASDGHCIPDAALQIESVVT
jgi:hypothetical protein